MSFYNAKPVAKTKPAEDDRWLCSNCQTMNDGSAELCSVCFGKRDATEAPCCCFQYIGDNPGCPVHGAQTE